jgi:hypothetical protein
MADERGAVIVYPEKRYIGDADLQALLAVHGVTVSLEEIKRKAGRFGTSSPAATIIGARRGTITASLTRWLRSKTRLTTASGRRGFRHPSDSGCGGWYAVCLSALRRRG